MSTADNKATLARAVSDFNDPSRHGAYIDFYAPNAVVYGLAPEPLRGREAIRGFYDLIWNAFPDATVKVDQQLAEGDRVGESFVVRGTHRGEFMGIPPTGRRVELTGMSIFRLADGKCVERWNQADFLGLLQQLGAAPAPRKTSRA